MGKFLDYTGLSNLINKIKLFSLDKEAYNSYAEYQLVPDEGIQLGIGASVLYLMFENGALVQQKEVFLTGNDTDYIIQLTVGYHQYVGYIQQRIDNYYVQPAISNDYGEVLILWKRDLLYNWEST